MRDYYINGLNKSIVTNYPEIKSIGAFTGSHVEDVSDAGGEGQHDDGEGDLDPGLSNCLLFVTDAHA
jgi:hypothetical protein